MIKDIIKNLQDDLYAPISFDLGFNIRTIRLELPQTHAIWDKMASELADHISTFRVKELLQAMPLLHANKEDISNEYILRAAIIVTGFAHAYYYPNGYTADLPLPESILIPMLEIAARIDKKFNNGEQNQHLYVGRTYLEDFLANWAFTSTEQNNQKIALDQIQINQLKLLVPFFNNQDEYVSTIVTGPLMQAKFAPTLQHISDIEKELAKDMPNTDIITQHIKEITKSIKEVKKAFMLMSPKLGNSNYVDQIIWPHTSPTIGKKAHPNEMPNTGVDSPVFHVMDKLLNRIMYNSKMGQNIINRFNAIPTNYQTLIMEMEAVGEKLFKFIQSSKNTELNNAFADLVMAYTGPTGLLDVHRKKAYGFLKMSFLSGRLSTNGNVTGLPNTMENKTTGLTPWGSLNIFFLKGMEERLDVLNRLGIDYQDKIKPELPVTFSVDNSTSFKRYQVPTMSSKDKLVAIYRGNVFDITAIAKTHPGGHRILSSLSGTDITTELEHVHHFSLNAITKSLRVYHLGVVETPEYSPVMSTTVNDWTAILFLITAVQNNIKNIWFFDKDTMNDRSRYMPFQFVMKTLDIMFGAEGYFDSLLNKIDSELLNWYRGKTLQFIKNPQSNQPIKFIDLGKLAKELGLQEIKERTLATVEDTKVNKLYIYKLYSQLINESLDLLESLKQQLMIQLDKYSAIDQQAFTPELNDEQNKQMKELVVAHIEDFINKIDKPQTLQLIRPKANNYLSPSFLLNIYSSFDSKMVFGAAICGSLMTFLALKDNKYVTSALFVAGISGFVLSKTSFFGQNTNSDAVRKIEPASATFNPS